MTNKEPAVLATLACNLDADILTAAFPLLEEDRVEALEWSFDTVFWAEQVPDWFADLLGTYGRQQRLIGHGVFFSLLAGRWTTDQQQWLAQLRQLATQFRFDHVTEHFGFFTGQNFHHGAPLHVPYSAATLRIGRDRVRRIYDACLCPVGLENLAFSYSLDEVKHHGEFLEKLVEPVNGFLILDLHNLYCQLHNFSISEIELLALYPLHRVREIHISGGSWEDSVLVPGKKVRRDTHDEAVPEEVFRLLAHTLPQCPNLKYVVLEQLGNGLKTETSKAQFRADFRRMQSLVEAHRQQNAGRELIGNIFQPIELWPMEAAAEDETLHQQQLELSRILETASSFEEAQYLLQSSVLADTAWKVEEWAPHMLETAVRIAQKWKK